MSLISVDLQKCTRCGLCALDCPYVVLSVDAERGPQVMREACVGCGHCVAVCPTAALDNKRCPLSSQTPDLAPFPPAEEVWHLLRARRSIRWFQDKKPDRGEITKLLDLARFAPTASNSQGINFFVYDQREVLNAMTAAVLDWGQAAVEDDLPISGIMHGLIGKYKQGLDSVLFNAPYLVVAASEHSWKRTRENSIFSLLYAHLYAPSLGLGSCWAGVFEACVSAGCRPVLGLLDLPEGMNFGAALAVGYPAYHHPRLVDRNPLNLVWKN
ncbi:MAG: nitroreductase family protein [Deltaproteobacteria bacterium]|jgi:nitroreductase/NAD-dependent dihydropyrimidine dehydrogenase PreA subunit|nr:nitroreductase family protein [Deltaproteobacteria bacterium]